MDNIPAKKMYLDLKIVSANLQPIAKTLEILKSIHGADELKSYVCMDIEDNDDNRKGPIFTTSQSSGCIQPVWNERKLIPVSLPLDDQTLELTLFHCVGPLIDRATCTYTPVLYVDNNFCRPPPRLEPLISRASLHLSDLLDKENDDDDEGIREVKLEGFYGRHHGKMFIKLALREEPPMQDGMRQGDRYLWVSGVYMNMLVAVFVSCFWIYIYNCRV